jgi:Domain of unknown function (DUF5658)
MWDVVRRRLDAQPMTLAVVALAFVAFSALDCFTTTIGLLHGAHEMNPFQAAMLSHGISAFYVTRAAVVTVVLAALQFLPRRTAAWIALSFTALTAFAVVANVETILH